MMDYLVILLLSTMILVPTSWGHTFSEAIRRINSHEAIETLKTEGDALESKGEIGGSWGDPMIKISAKNFPEDSLRNDETPMTGIEIALSQKIALTTKYGKIKKAFLKMGQAKKYESDNKKEQLIFELWITLINDKKLTIDQQVFKENLDWLNNMIRISKQLYANGKISQQALLELKIRQSEIKSQYQNRNFDLKSLQERITYLLNTKEQLKKETIPWEILAKRQIKNIDFRELALQSNASAKEHLLTASKLDYIPDLTLSIGHTQRADIDKNGDFISASISFPMPFSTVKYSGQSLATSEVIGANKKLIDYRRNKESMIKILEHEIKKLSTELAILNGQTIQFASDSKNITSKSYELGQSTYLELLQSELTLQNLLLKRNSLQSDLEKKQLEYKYLAGEKLYE